MKRGIPASGPWANLLDAVVVEPKRDGPLDPLDERLCRLLGVSIHASARAKVSPWISMVQPAGLPRIGSGM